LHREDGPAFIQYYVSKPKAIHQELYYKNGIVHREDGPADLKYDGAGWLYFEKYVVDGLSHRDLGPAHIHYNADGSIKASDYYKQGQLIKTIYGE